MNVFSSRRLILISVNSFSANDPPTINVYKECTQHNNSSVCRRFNWSHEKKIIKSKIKWKKNDKNTSKSINQSTKQKRNTLWQGSRKLLLTNYASHFQWPMNRIVQARKKKNTICTILVKFRGFRRPCFFWNAFSGYCPVKVTPVVCIAKIHREYMSHAILSYLRDLQSRSR